MTHPPRFYRRQNPHERVERWNELVELTEDIAERVEDLEQSGVPGGAGPTDPGDLTVYYENGKA